MMRTLSLPLLLLVVLPLAACAPEEETTSTTVMAAAPAQGGLEGVWKVTERSYKSTETSWTDTNPQPSLSIYTKTHYSNMYVRTGQDGTSQPRKLSAGDTMTDTEIVAAYRSFRAESGTYEATGSKITYHVMVNNNPNRMSGDVSWTETYEIEGDTLRVTSKNEAGDRENVATLVRVE